MKRQTTVEGIDRAKYVFQVHGINDGFAVIICRELSRYRAPQCDFGDLYNDRQVKLVLHGLRGQ